MNNLSICFLPNNPQIKFETVGSPRSKAKTQSAPEKQLNTVCNIFSRTRAVKNRTLQSKPNFMNILPICFLPYNPQIKFETVEVPGATSTHRIFHRFAVQVYIIDFRYSQRNTTSQTKNNPQTDRIGRSNHPVISRHLTLQIAVAKKRKYIL